MSTTDILIIKRDNIHPGNPPSTIPAGDENLFTSAKANYFFYKNRPLSHTGIAALSSTQYNLITQLSHFKIQYELVKSKDLSFQKKSY